MLVVEEFGFVFWIGVVARADAGDFSWGVKQRVGNLTGDNINLIAIGNRDQHIRFFDTGIDQHIRVRPGADYGADIKTILQSPQSSFIDVDNGYIVVLAGKMLCECAANLPCPNNYYFHYLLARLFIRLLLACFTQSRVIKPVVAIDHGE